jgi:succinyl-diaminopimelate desuccinylase
MSSDRQHERRGPTQQAGTETSAVKLARQLIRLDTAGAPGGELRAAELVAGHLATAGIPAQVQEFGPGRANLVAHLRTGRPDGPTLLLSGHLDTVAVGDTQWTFDPLGAEISGDRLYGRGSTDMKGGVAGLVVAFERLADQLDLDGRQGSIVLALTGAEESGCQGATAVLDLLPGAVDAILVGEATGGRMAAGHKGALWVDLQGHGLAAHASTPELGKSAILPVARVIQAISDRFARTATASTSELGIPTAVTTTIRGGSARNVVPDNCFGTVDFRLTEVYEAESALRFLNDMAGEDVEVRVELSLPPILTAADEPWLQEVAVAAGLSSARMTVGYFTDASVLAPALGHPPVCLLGPGDPALAHRTDEWCSVGAIDGCVANYVAIGGSWLSGATATITHPSKDIDMVDEATQRCPA